MDITSGAPIVWGLRATLWEVFEPFGGPTGPLRLRGAAAGPLDLRLFQRPGLVSAQEATARAEGILRGARAPCKREAGRAAACGGRLRRASSLVDSGCCTFASHFEGAGGGHLQ